MCTGFGCLITKDLTLHTTFPPRSRGNIHHSDILADLNWKDNDYHLRRWIRIECEEYDIKNFSVDEMESLPGWAVDEAADIFDHQTPRQDMVDLTEKVMRRYTLLYIEFCEKSAALYHTYMKSDMQFEAWQAKHRVLVDRYAKKFAALPGCICHTNLRPGMVSYTEIDRDELLYLKQQTGIRKILKEARAKRKGGKP